MWTKDGRALEGIPNLWALSEGQGRNLKGAILQVPEKSCQASDAMTNG